MDQPFKQEPAWDPLAEAAKNLYPNSATERRHSSSVSTSTNSTNDSNECSGSRGRRPRPSVASGSSQLPTVREKNLERIMNDDRSPSLVLVDSEETVVNSQKVDISEALFS